MKTKSNVRAGALTTNHNQTVARHRPGLRLRTNLKAGALTSNHNQIVRHRPGLRVKTNLRAGAKWSLAQGATA